MPQVVGMRTCWGLVVVLLFGCCTATAIAHTAVVAHSSRQCETDADCGSNSCSIDTCEAQLGVCHHRAVDCRSSAASASASASALPFVDPDRCFRRPTPTASGLPPLLSSRPIPIEYIVLVDRALLQRAFDAGPRPDYHRRRRFVAAAITRFVASLQQTRVYDARVSLVLYWPEPTPTQESSPAAAVGVSVWNELTDSGSALEQEIATAIQFYARNDADFDEPAPPPSPPATIEHTLHAIRTVLNAAAATAITPAADRADCGRLKGRDPKRTAQLIPRPGAIVHLILFADTGSERKPPPLDACSAGGSDSDSDGESGCMTIPANRYVEQPAREKYIPPLHPEPAHWTSDPQQLKSGVASTAAMFVKSNVQFTAFFEFALLSELQARSPSSRREQHAVLALGDPSADDSYTDCTHYSMSATLRYLKQSASRFSIQSQLLDKGIRARVLSFHTALRERAVFTYPASGPDPPSYRSDRDDIFYTDDDLRDAALPDGQSTPASLNPDYARLDYLSSARAGDLELNPLATGGTIDCMLAIASRDTVPPPHASLGGGGSPRYCNLCRVPDQTLPCNASSVETGLLTCAVKQHENSGCSTGEFCDPAYGCVQPQQSTEVMAGLNRVVPESVPLLTPNPARATEDAPTTASLSPPMPHRPVPVITIDELLDDTPYAPASSFRQSSIPSRALVASAKERITSALYRHVLKHRHPVVFRASEIVKRWPAFNELRWTPDLLRSHFLSDSSHNSPHANHTLKEVKISSQSQFYHLDRKQAIMNLTRFNPTVNYEKQNVSIDEFFDVLNKEKAGGDKSYYYFGDLLPSLTPSLVPNELLYATPQDQHRAQQFLWMSNAGPWMHTHFDMDHNMFVQMIGRKKWVLTPPWAHGMHVFPRVHPLWHKSQINSDHSNDQSNTADFPAHLSVQSYTTTLSAGDILYVPPFWWHHVRALTTSVSLSTWSRHTPQYKSMNNVYARAHAFDEAITPERKISALRLFVDMLITEVAGLGQTNHFIATRLVDERYRVIRKLFQPKANDTVPVASDAPAPAATTAAAADGAAAPVTPSDPPQLCAPVLVVSRWMYTKTQSDVKEIAAQFFKLSPEIRDMLFVDYLEEVCVDVIGIDRLFAFFRHCFTTQRYALSKVEDDQPSMKAKRAGALFS